MFCFDLANCLEFDRATAAKSVRAFTFGDNGSIHFSAPPEIIAILSVYCVFAVVFLVLKVVSYYSTAAAIGHRGPISMLIVSLSLAFSYCIAQVASIVLGNLTNFDPVPAAIITLDAIAGLFNWWCNIVLFAAVFLLFRDREIALQSVAEPRNRVASVVQTVIHAILLILMFSLSTAAVALSAELQTDVSNGNVTVFDFDNRESQIENIAYAADAFFILTCIDICVSAFLLHRRVRRVGATNQITKVLLYVASPFVALSALSTFVFTIVLSPSVLNNSNTSLQSALRAELMGDIFGNLFFTAIVITLLILPFKRQNWDIQGGVAYSQPPSWNDPKPSVTPAPAYENNYAPTYDNSFTPQPQYTDYQPPIVTQVAHPYSV
ncbi:hypothetical protein BD410DRAFT_786480 [Rickenella mellea]|uniref:PalH-domain-containing protein n=1 Tax=Rickenella mellea TaxID=50990 RepID=A0A4Y7Q9M2_9AGAM|nr:hypothetical protein BD410DRAFT_786480 [Rickenella mellea]